MKRHYSKVVTPEFIKAVLLNEEEAIAKLNPGYSPISLALFRNMASCYILDPESLKTKYLKQNKKVMQYIMTITDKYKDIIRKTIVRKSRPKRRKIKEKNSSQSKVLSTAINYEIPKEKDSDCKQIETKEILTLLSDTIKTIQMFIEKL